MAPIRNGVFVYSSSAPRSAIAGAQEPRRPLLISNRSGDMYVPKISGAEALHEEIAHFVHCLERGEIPVNDSAAGSKRSGCSKRPTGP